MLAKIARSETILCECRSTHFDGMGLRRYQIANGLSDLGLIKIRESALGGKLNTQKYTLTDAGWEMMGGKPWTVQ